MKAHGVHPAAQQPAKTDDKHVAAKQLEAFFLRRLLAEARPQGGGLIDGGFAGDTFKQMLDEAIADKMAGAGGIGMAEMFAKQLGAPAETAMGAIPPTTNQLPSHDLGPEMLGAPRMMLPVAGTPTSGYGMRADPVHGGTTNHPGFDLAAKAGTPVAAAAGGTITHAGPAGTYGNLVTVRHDNGFETRYAHLSTVTVKAGDRVDAGQQIGNVGSTGFSTGPHLHFEVRHDGKTMDPAPLLPLKSSGGRTNR
jgi:murein DD-endopeptidase MepM/ murein hydrolase activator NlpD